jgi:pilus assembly protein Flp/PilA
MFERIRELLRDNDGATMVEYGLLVALIALACIGVVTTLGLDISSLFGKVDQAVNSAGS